MDEETDTRTWEALYYDSEMSSDEEYLHRESIGYGVAD
jgi:hypothetical protein